MKNSHYKQQLQGPQLQQQQYQFSTLPRNYDNHNNLWNTSNGNFSSLKNSQHQKHVDPVHKVISNIRAKVIIDDKDVYVVDIPKQPPVTLSDLKKHMPMKKQFKYFVETIFDGEKCYTEISKDTMTIQVIEGKFVAKCYTLTP